MDPPQGLFVVLEGADGCGKSTQARRLAERLRERGSEVLHVRDPGATGLSEGIRALLLDRSQGEVAVPAETFLYLAARAQLAQEVIGPALRRGTHVVCERWTLSTEVYQGLVGGFGAEEVRRAAALATAGVEPELEILLDVAVGEGLRRLEGEPDRMEAKGERFHARVVEGYRTLAATRPRCVTLEPSGLEEVAERVWQTVAGHLGDSGRVRV